jgi:hypothetical protein
MIEDNLMQVLHQDHDAAVSRHLWHFMQVMEGC